METLQQQLTTINAKLEGLHQKIDALSTQVAELSAQRTTSGSSSAAFNNGCSTVQSIAHRDVLEDEDPMIAHETRGKSMSQELQMQRLMAQLTAAYNRIAALEEQLLSQRTY